MAARFTFRDYIYLNIYAFAADFLILSAAVFPIFIFSVYSCVGSCIVILLLLKVSLPLHASAAEKKRTALSLIEDNSERYDETTLSKYMNAPCTRLIVRLVLQKIGRRDQFPVLKKKFQKRFYTPKRTTGFKIRIYDDHGRLIETERTRSSD